MVLPDIAQGANPIVKTAAILNTDIFKLPYEDAFNKFVVPAFLEEIVEKAKRKNVLECLFRKIVVDAKTCSSLKSFVSRASSALALFFIAPNGFL